jgi:hypothetical protein
LPAETEMEQSLAFRAECETRDAWLEDVLWTLLNTREFLFNH